jgi:hypothetical protein
MEKRARTVIRVRRLVGHVTILVLAVGCRASASEQRASPKAVALPDRVTGANLRAVGDSRRGYGSDKARETMNRLRGMGVNTIGILMEGRMSSLDDREIRLQSSGDLESIQSALEDANELGFATILIPHLYLDDAKWRGEIRWDGREGEDEWWTSYEAFIMRAAQVASESGTTVLSIGVELKAMSSAKTTRQRMAHVVKSVRGTFHGLLTYNANWDEAEEVGFWDLVDLAGVNGYYPLLPDPVRGAEEISRRLARLAMIADRKLLVLEVGYRSSPLSFVRPWEWPESLESAEVDDGAQARAFAAILSTWLDAPGVRGLLFWVVPTDPDDPASEPRHGFNPINKPAEEVIRRAFLGGRGAREAARSPGTPPPT